MIEEGNQERIEVEMLLNQKNHEDARKMLLDEIYSLKKENKELKSKLSLSQEKNKKFSEKLDKLSELINDV